MSETARLTVVPDEGAATMLCGLLREEGIVCMHRVTNVGAGVADASATFGGWREVLVRQEDLERAAEVLVGLAEDAPGL